MMAMMPTATMNTLNVSAMEAANRTLTFSVLPIAISTNGANPCVWLRPAKIAAEIATQSGHDIVQLVGSGTEKWAAALIDVQDVCDRLGKKHGGFTPLA